MFAYFFILFSYSTLLVTLKEKKKTNLHDMYSTSKQQ